MQSVYFIAPADWAEVSSKLEKNDEPNLLKNCIFNILGGETLIELFGVLILQIFCGKSNIVVCEVTQNLKN